MNDFLNITAFLSFLLLIGTFVKSKVKILQELFIPASVIGGIIGLFLNSNFLRQYIDRKSVV